MSENKTRGTASITLPQLDAESYQSEYDSKLKEHLQLNNSEDIDTKELKKSTDSDFSNLLRQCNKACDVADYIKKHHMDALKKNIGGINKFMQIISQRDEKLYSELFTEYKAEVAVLLERLLETLETVRPTAASRSSRKKSAQTRTSQNQTSSFTPASHEFVIRCEDAGVKKKNWGLKLFEKLEPHGDETEGDAAIQLLPDAPPTTMSTKAVMKRLAAIDTKGHLMRRVELAQFPEDLISVIELVGEKEESLDADEKIQILMKIISKSRRILSGVNGKRVRDETEKIVEPLSSDIAQPLITSVLNMSNKLFSQGTTSTPIKLSKFLEWCKNTNKDYIPKSHEEVAKTTEEQAIKAIENQAENMDIVMRLKQPDLSKDSFLEIINSISDIEKNIFLKTGMDIISGLAVAVEKRFKSEEEISSLVCQRLINTHNLLHVELPRRALSFIASERQRVKDAEKCGSTLPMSHRVVRKTTSYSNVITNTVFRLPDFHKKAPTETDLRLSKRGFIGRHRVAVAHLPSYLYWLQCRGGISIAESLNLVNQRRILVNNKVVTNPQALYAQRPWSEMTAENVQVFNQFGVKVDINKRAKHRSYYIIDSHSKLSSEVTEINPFSFVHQLQAIDSASVDTMQLLLPNGANPIMRGLMLATNDTIIKSLWEQQRLGNYGEYDIRFPAGTPDEVIEEVRTHATKVIKDVSKLMPEDVVVPTFARLEEPPLNDYIDKYCTVATHRDKRLLVQTPQLPKNFFSRAKHFIAATVVLRNGPFELNNDLRNSFAEVEREDAFEQMRSGRMRTVSRRLTSAELIKLFQFEKKLKTNKVVCGLRDAQKACSLFDRESNVEEGPWTVNENDDFEEHDFF